MDLVFLWGGSTKKVGVAKKFWCWTVGGYYNHVGLVIFLFGGSGTEGILLFQLREDIQREEGRDGSRDPPAPLQSPLSLKPEPWIHKMCDGDFRTARCMRFLSMFSESPRRRFEAGFGGRIGNY